jgi:hypothetical protein
VHFDRYYYQYRDKAKLSDVSSLIHRQLEPLFGAIISKPQFNWQSGIWTQEFEEQTREIYLSFPYRTNLGWIIRSFEKHLPQDAYLESLKNSNLQFRNIGFDTDERNAYPSITIYFTMPLTEHFPGSDAELVSMTCDFFGYD